MLTLKEDTMLGNIPADWERQPLGKLLSQHYPGDWGEDRGPHLTKVLRSTNLTNEGRLDLEDIALRALPQRKSEILAPKTHDILLERSGGGPGQPVGRVGFVQADMPEHGFSNFLHLLRPDPKEVDPRFLAWVLYRVNKTGRVIRQEQIAIARILDAVDTAQERTRAAVDAASSLRDALVQVLFERGIAQDGGVRCAEKTPQEFIATKIGLIPREWSVEPLSSVADVERGRFSPRPRNDPRFYDGAYPFIQTGEVAQAKGRVITSFTQTLNDAGKAVSRLFPAGTVMVTIAANIGETAILGLPMCAPDSLVGVMVKGPNVPRYVELCLRRLRRKLLALAPRSAQANINLTFLRPLRIAVPKPEEQERIAEVVDAAEARVQAIEARCEALQTLKSALMHDLLTGRVRVANAIKAATS